MSHEIDAVNSLTRIIKASAEWVSDIHRFDKLSDRYGDRIGHIRANLDRIEELLEETE